MIKDFVTKEDLSLFTTGSRFALASIFLKENMQNIVATFDLFIREMPKSRNYFIFAGLEHVADYLKNLKFNSEQLKWLKKRFNLSSSEIKYFKKFRFKGDMYAMPEGSFFFPNEPIIRITAPINEAQMIEAFLINAIYLQTALASKLARFAIATNNKSTAVGYSRSYGIDAAMKSSRINEIFGISQGLSLYNFKNEKPSVFNAGTYHYFIKSFNNEEEAFKIYFKHMNGKGYILIDTYDSIRGIKNFIKAAKESEKNGIKANGLQLDSGDLYKLSITARKMLDQAGLNYVKIFAMSNLDEWKVAVLEKKKAPIDVYAGTTELLTPSDAPTLELVYKLSEIKKNGKIFPKMKTSTKKMSLPGKKQIFRKIKNKKYVGDVIGIDGEKQKGKKMLIPIIKNGKLVYQFPSIEKIRKHFYKEKEKFNPSIFNVNKKFNYPVSISDKLKKLTEKTKKEIEISHNLKK
jgi:nicotinate phosphoribosyltransferase